MIETSSRFRAAEFVNLARWAKVITARQCSSLLSEWERTDAGDMAEIATRRGLVTGAQADAIGRRQTRGGPAPDEAELGRLAISRGFLSVKELKECVACQKAMSAGEYTPYLASVAFEHGILTEEEIYVLLEFQERNGRGLLPELRRDLGLDPSAHVAAMRSVIGNRYWVAALAALALGIGLFAAVLAKDNLPATIAGICSDPACGRTLVWRPGSTSPRCPRCGGARIATPLYCGKCKTSFPLKLVPSGEGKYKLEPCPKCVNLDAVRIPREVAEACR